MSDNVVEIGRTLEERFAARLMMNVPGRGNAKVEQVIQRVNADDELYALWTAANVTAVERLGMTDHGPTHVKIVMNIAGKLFRLLTDRGIQPGVTINYGLPQEDAEVVVLLAALLHDVGMSIHRADHESFSLFIAQQKVRELLDGLYDVKTATILRSEVLHAIIAHRSGGKPLTLEAGHQNIHSLSAYAIEDVKISPGRDKAVRVEIAMSNSAGIFQVDELLAEKLRGSGIEPHVEVVARIDAEHEKRLVPVFRI